MKGHQKLLLNIALVAVAVGVVVTTASGSRDDGVKGVICHATGSATNPFVGVVVGIDTSTPLTIFSNNGHLDENGNQLSGHEHDFYLGGSPPYSKSSCPGPTPAPSPAPNP